MTPAPSWGRGTNRPVFAMGPGNRVPCERSQTHDRERILWHRLENHGPSQKPSASGYPGWTETSPAAWAVLYTTSRIKSPESACRKLRRQGPAGHGPGGPDPDPRRGGGAGDLRLPGRCVPDGPVFGGAAGFAVLQTKDYISRPKENGYRSYHLILGILDGPGKGMTVEVQPRTIAIDCWASLEHQIKYKRRVPHEHLVGRNSSATPTRSPRWTCPWRPSGSCSTGPEPAAERTPGEETLPRRGGLDMGPFGPKQPAAGTPPHRESWPGRAFLARKLFWAPWVMESPGRRWPSGRGGGVVVPVVLPGLLWGFVGVAVFAAVEAGVIGPQVPAFHAVAALAHPPCVLKA